MPTCGDMRMLAYSNVFRYRANVVVPHCHSMRARMLLSRNVIRCHRKSNSHVETTHCTSSFPNIRIGIRPLKVRIAIHELDFVGHLPPAAFGGLAQRGRSHSVQVWALFGQCVTCVGRHQLSGWPSCRKPLISNGFRALRHNNFQIIGNA
jgi:hypothetical protein